MPPDNTNVYYALVLILVTEIEMRDGKKPTQTLQGNDRQCLRPAMAFTIKGANPEQAGGRRRMPLPWQAVDSAKAQQPQP
jgi:hypothetical protein